MINSKTISALCLLLLAVGLMSGCSQRIVSGFAAGRERVQGERLVKQEKYQEAIEHFKKSIASYPSGPTYADLGIAYEKIGSYREAADNLNKAIDRFDMAVEKRAEIVKLRKLSGAQTLGSAYSHAASVYLKLNNLELAKTYIKKAIELEPAVARNFCVSAQVEYGFKNDKQAMAEATRSIDIDPHDSEAYRIRGLCELSTGKYSQSIADCDAAIAISADDMEAQKIKSQAVARISKQAMH